MVPLLILCLTLSFQSPEDKNVFAQLLKSESKAEKHLVWLNAFAGRIHFDAPIIISASRRLLTLKLKPADIETFFPACADAAAAFENKTYAFGQITEVIGRMHLDPKWTFEGITKLEGLGLPAYQILEEATGMSRRDLETAAFRNRMNAREAARLLIEGFKKEYGGLAEKVATP